MMGAKSYLSRKVTVSGDDRLSGTYHLSVMTVEKDEYGHVTDISVAPFQKETPGVIYVDNELIAEKTTGGWTVKGLPIF